MNKYLAMLTAMKSISFYVLFLFLTIKTKAISSDTQNKNCIYIDGKLNSNTFNMHLNLLNIKYTDDIAELL